MKGCRMNSSTLATALLVAGLISGSAFAAAPDDDPTPVWARTLASGARDQLDPALKQAIAERHATTVSLVQVLQLPASPQNRPRIAAAMKAAGLIRAAETVEAILDKIDFQEFGSAPATHPSNPSVDYLAVKTLIEIGTPAVAPAIRRLGAETDLWRRILYLETIEHIIGPACARSQLESARDKAKAAGLDTKGFEAALKVPAAPSAP